MWHADMERWRQMSSAGVFRRVEGVYRCVVRRQIPRQRVWARMTLYDYQILRPSGSGDDKADLATHVVEIRTESWESSAARVKVPGAIVRTWWRMRLPLVVGFLGFGRDMSWSTSVLLVSLGEGLMCTDLIGRGTDCLVVEFWHSIEPWWLRDAMESRSSKQKCVTSDSDVHVRIFFALLEIFVWCQERSLALIPC